MRFVCIMVILIIVSDKEDYAYAKNTIIRHNRTSVYYIECREDIECNIKGNCDAFCADFVDSSGAQCIFYFNLWHKLKPHCQYRPNCPKQCTSNGVCKFDLGIVVPTCLCETSKFYGHQCEKERLEGEPLYFRMFQWYMKNAFVKPGFLSDFVFKVTAEDENVIKKMMYAMETELGYIESEVNIEQTYSCSGYTCADVHMKVMYPHVPINNKINVTLYTLREKVRGYSTDIFIHLRPSSRASLYTYRLPAMVDYSLVNLKCIPDLLLKNCGQYVTSAAAFHRNVPVDINYVVKYYADGALVSKTVEDLSCSPDDATFIWTWMRYYREWPYRGKQVGGKIDRSPMRIQPFELNFGLYLMNLRIKRVFSGGSNENFNECFFEIVPLPLRAIVEGGEERTELKDLGFRLRASKSYDPNQPADKQELYIGWICECLTKNIANCETLCKNTPRKLRVHQDYYVPSRKLEYNAVYKFTLMVYSYLYGPDKCKFPACKDVSPQYASVTVTIADESVKEIRNYRILCEENCDEKIKTNEILLLKVKERDPQHQKYNASQEFKWTYSKADDGVVQSVDSIKIDGLPSRMLAIKEDALEQGSSYTIILSEADNDETMDKFSFETFKFETTGTCTVAPETGIAGLSRFDIECSGFEGSLLFEFYDKSDEDLGENVIFNGRMIGTLYEEGIISDVCLTRGNVIVYIMNDKGLFTSIKLKVELTSWNISEEVMSEIVKNITETTKLGILTRTMGYISFIPDVLPSFADKNEVLHLLLEEISKVPLKTLGDVKLSASTLTNVLLTLNKPTHLTLKPDLMLDTLTVIKRQADIFRSCVLNRALSQWMSPKEVRQVATAILNCLNAGLKCRDESTANREEESLGFATLYLLRRNARKTEDTIDLIKDILSYVQVPGLPPSNISSSDNAFEVWTMGNDEENPVTRMLERDDQIPFGVSSTLLKKYQEDQSGRELIFQVVSMEENAFYWSKSDVKSKLVSLSVATRREKEKLRKIELLDTPISVRITMEKNLTNTSIVGSTTQLDPNLDPLDIDLRIPIHRIDAVPKGFLTIRFIYPPTNESLQVLLMKEFRPDYKLMKKKAIIINSSQPDYPIKWQQIEVPKFLFLGVLPGPDVPMNKTVEYKFEISTSLCMLWTGGQWSSIGCKISHQTTADEARCECTHLSIFAAAFPVPPQSIDPFGDIKLFLNVLDNPIVVVFITVLLIIYLLLLLWARYRDTADVYKGRVIVLEDNFPEDKFPYLVAVYTSARFNAGTTSHVGIKLIGKEGRSRAHILSCKQRRVLKRNTDDWFMIYSPRALGDVYGIHLWHDNSGSSPEWFCEKIMVYDLRERTEAVFIVEQWLALHKDEFPEANILISSNQDMLSVKRLFLDNCVIGFRDAHTFLSVFVRHPRSEISRVQRISILMCSVMVAMLCSIMFYEPEDEEAPVDDYNYDVGTKEIIVSVQTLFITALLTLFVLYAFRKSYKPPRMEYRSTLRYRKDDLAEKMSQQSQFTVMGERQNKDKSFYQNYVRYVSKHLKGSPFVPVTLWDSDKKVQIRKIWYAIAWVGCISVIGGCAYLVMLYGLKIGFVQSQKWLTSLVMSITEDIFVLSPGRIILVAILLSMAFQKSVKMNLHGVNLQDVMAARPPNEYLYLEFLLAKRSHPMYDPLSTTTRRAMLKKQEIRSQWWALIDFTNALVFVIVVSSVMYRLWTSRYHSFQHIQNLFVDSHIEHLGAVDLTNVKNVSTFETYLEVTFIENMFNLQWYNGRQLTQLDQEPEGIQRYWSKDGLQRMVGKPLIRQVRLLSKECSNSLFPSMVKCLPRWSFIDEDQDIYGEKWVAADADADEENSPWAFTDRRTTLWFTNQRFYGFTGTLYDVSGYMTTLGASQQEAELTLLKLRKNNWQDVHTRAVFLELTVYNVNEHLFSQITLLVEYFIIGHLKWDVKVIPVSRIVLFGFWEVLFLWYAIYYVFRSAYLINRKGLMDYLRSVNNVCRVVVVFLAFVAIIIWCVHHRTSIRYIETFLKSVQDDHFDFDKFIRNFTFLQVILSVLLCLGITRAFILLRGGRSMINPYYTLIISLSWIFSLSVIFIILLIFLSTEKYFFNTYLHFRTKELVLHRGATKLLEPVDFASLGVQAFVVIRMVSMVTLSALFMILFMHFTRVAKVYKVRESDKFNFVIFIIARFRKLCSRRK